HTHTWRPRIRHSPALAGCTWIRTATPATGTCTWPGLEVLGSLSSRLGDLRLPSCRRGPHHWRHALPPDQHQVRPVRALTWPTASRMSGVARLMKRLTRWPEP